VTIPILRPFQAKLKSDVFQAWNQGARNVLMRLDTGGGKCLGRGTPVLMFDGTIKPVELVTVGDVLMGPDSAPRRVLSTCRGREPLYSVVPTKGDAYVVNESHILSLQTTRETKNSVPAGEIVNISVTDFLAKTNRWRHLHKGWRAAVDFPTARLNPALPPYLLGIWLGDGSSRGPAITSIDPEIVVYLATYAAQHGLKVRSEAAGGRSRTFYVTSPDRRHGKNIFRRVLVDMGLIENKHIPHEYKTGNRDQRLEILAGLMDTDGSYTGKGFDFVSVNRRLADDVTFISRSLGFSAKVNPCMKSCNGGPKEEYFRVCISGNVEDIPCRIPRKKANVRRQKKSVLRTGIRLEPIGEGDYFGFEIDGDRLFLLGDFTVTHNTVTLADIVRDHNGASAVIAHRQELVGQLSLTIARYGVRHNVIAADATRRNIARLHVEELGYSLIDPGSRCVVASVDTLARQDLPPALAAMVTLWIVDEGHHLVEDNKWHRAIEKFTHPGCRGLLPTATPKRADGKGLGRDQGGVADVMIQGPPMRWLIDQGYLTDYRIICPPSDLQILVDVSASGDWSSKQLREAAKRSHIVGDVVTQYLKWARGKLGITFATDVETAVEMTGAYRIAGVRAETLTGKTDDYARRHILRRFAAREIDQIVAVDIISEGFDLPAIEVASMARPTASLALYMQQFGRTLRPLEGKGKALIIDHAANVIRHQGPPDRPRVWSLERSRNSNGPSDAIPFRVCVGPAKLPTHPIGGCFEPYERIYRECPHCGYYPEPATRSSPKAVDGDMDELDPAVLAVLRQDIAAVDMSRPDKMADLMAKGGSHMMIMANVNRHEERREMQDALRAAMGGFGYRCRALDPAMPDSEIQRRFFFAFGCDVYSAMALGTREAAELAGRINTKVLC
jgi:superfamily II DNA or RNA helicase